MSLSESFAVGRADKNEISARAKRPEPFSSGAGGYRTVFTPATCRDCYEKNLLNAGHKKIIIIVITRHTSPVPGRRVYRRRAVAHKLPLSPHRKRRCVPAKKDRQPTCPHPPGRSTRMKPPINPNCVPNESTYSFIQSFF